MWRAHTLTGRFCGIAFSTTGVVNAAINGAAANSLIPGASAVEVGGRNVAPSPAAPPSVDVIDKGRL